MSKRVMWWVLALGLWLMMSPFAVFFLNSSKEVALVSAFKVLWEDLVLGFGITVFAFCRLASYGTFARVSISSLAEITATVSAVS